MASMLASLQRGLPSRVFPSFPSLTRSFISRAAKRPLPAKRDPATTVQGTSPAPYPLETIQTPEDFLTAIGRQAEAKITASTWGDFWRMDGRTMKAAGVTVRDRR
ncbi:unnamed protein product [Cyclocybe aegerita]|uniref:Small ribosomal subunit protein mS41 SAM domain-containing protein n=1 Tax=Cyclocybe aegerita TaxID=1973307 RepID=A0A8S0WXR7_CYCAE|nr:unnamed protein product [Cyclocybe aegerita]